VIRESLAALENELLDALAVNTRCRGVTVIRDPHPDYDHDNWLSVYQANAKIKNQNPYWDSYLDYTPGLKVYGWTLFPEKVPGRGSRLGAMVQGEGATPQVADQICIVVTGGGASIR
jgi:hypothetical protein